MRLVTFDGRFGRVEGDHVIPMGSSIQTYLSTHRAEDGDPIDIGLLRLRAPILRPEKILCVGLNYHDHAAETGAQVPDHPVLFAKFANSVVGPGDAIEVPHRVTQEVDYEAELGVVIGRPARDVSVDEALSYVAGYTCLNDVSARDLQFLSDQWLLGKAIDTFLPMGPWIVTTDEIPDPQRLDIRCFVNGEVVQSSNTAEMVFGVAQLVSFITRTITLVPGDVIATGTPPGVGFKHDPPLFLKDGDDVSVEIDGLGRLENRIRHRH